MSFFLFLLAFFGVVSVRIGWEALIPVVGQALFGGNNSGDSGYPAANMPPPQTPEQAALQKKLLELYSSQVDAPPLSTAQFYPTRTPLYAQGGYAVPGTMYKPGENGQPASKPWFLGGTSQPQITGGQPSAPQPQVIAPSPVPEKKAPVQPSQPAPSPQYQSQVKQTGSYEGGIYTPPKPSNPFQFKNGNANFTGMTSVVGQPYQNSAGLWIQNVKDQSGKAAGLAYNPSKSETPTSTGPGVATPGVTMPKPPLDTTTDNKITPIKTPATPRLQQLPGQNIQEMTKNGWQDLPGQVQQSDIANQFVFPLPPEYQKGKNAEQQTFNKIVTPENWGYKALTYDPNKLEQYSEEKIRQAMDQGYGQNWADAKKKLSLDPLNEQYQYALQGADAKAAKSGLYNTAQRLNQQFGGNRSITSDYLKNVANLETQLVLENAARMAQATQEGVGLSAAQQARQRQDAMANEGLRTQWGGMDVNLQQVKQANQAAQFAADQWRQNFDRAVLGDTNQGAQRDWSNQYGMVQNALSREDQQRKELQEWQRAQEAENYNRTQEAYRNAYNSSIPNTALGNSYIAQAQLAAQQARMGQAQDQSNMQGWAQIANALKQGVGGGQTPPIVSGNSYPDYQLQYQNPDQNYDWWRK